MQMQFYLLHTNQRAFLLSIVPLQFNFYQISSDYIHFLFLYI